MSKSNKFDFVSHARTQFNKINFEITQNIIYEDNHLLVLNKPVGIATMGVTSEEVSLFTLAKRYIKVKYQKPGEVYLGVVSRLDLPVSGVLLFARTSKAASRLNEQFGKHDVKKIYHAFVEGRLPYKHSELTDFICEDKQNRKLWIAKKTGLQASCFNLKEAKLRYNVLQEFKNTTLVEVELLTGRKHQIRLQLSHQGTPIIGDGKYGAKPIKEAGICLHAYSLTVLHPTTKKPIEFRASTPDWTQWKQPIVRGRYQMD